MRVLGIETSCDDSGVGIVACDCMPSACCCFSINHRPRLLAHQRHSQIAVHQPYGGVVPEIASRDHLVQLLPLIDSTLQQAQCSLSEIDLIAVTTGPGLAGSLLVGTALAHSIGISAQCPVIGVHHLEGHILTPLISSDQLTFPYLALLVSGGHTEILQVNALGDYHRLGESIDDAVGEAFDKVAQLLGLGYPGGPAVSALANLGTPNAIKLPRPLIHSKDLNMSFSGLKTAVLTATQQFAHLTDAIKADIARGFVDAAIDVLTSKTLKALKQTNMSELVIAGGVGANQQLRDELGNACAQLKLGLHYPPAELCTDNGAMIALAGWMHAHTPEWQPNYPQHFEVKPRWPLSKH